MVLEGIYPLLVSEPVWISLSGAKPPSERTLDARIFVARMNRRREVPMSPTVDTPFETAVDVIADSPGDESPPRAAGGRPRALRQLLAVALFSVVGSLVIACGDGEPAPRSDPLADVVDSAHKTAAAGPSRVSAEVHGSEGQYALIGAFDPSDGYRLCAEIQRTPHPPNSYFRGRTLWLEERNGTYGTLTAAGAPCPREGWLDDHPPTLPLSEVGEPSDPAGGETGAEDFLHVALLALTQMKSSAIEASLEGEPDESTSYEVVIDFRHFDQDPPARDEDTWTLRPLLRSLGRYPVDVRVQSGGFIDRMRFAAPGLHTGELTPSAVGVDLRLSDFGEAPRVPRVDARAIE